MGPGPRSRKWAGRAKGRGKRGAVIRYGLDRSILPQQAYPFSVITNRLRHIEIVPGGTVMWARDRFAGSDDRFDRLLLVSAGDTVELVAGTPTHTAPSRPASVGRSGANGSRWPSGARTGGTCSMGRG